MKIINAVGLHARPAYEFVKLAAKFKSHISIRDITKGSGTVDAKSTLNVLILGVKRDHEVELNAEGEDETQAARALRELIEADFTGRF